MSDQLSLTGPGLFLELVVSLAATKVRVSFSDDPLATNPAGVADGLNPVNYFLEGPGVGYVDSVSVVPDDTLSLDLNLSAALAAGVWNLTVSNITTATGTVLSPPTTLSFTVADFPEVEPVSGGATDDSAESIIRKHLNPALKGKAWNALIAALSVGDRLNWDNAKKAFNQLFKSTAEGLFLDRKAGDDGIARPKNIGMPDDLFRQLAIKLTSEKLTQEALLEIIEIFYGSDAVRANITTEIDEPYELSDGQTLSILIDGTDEFTCTFKDNDFTNISEATALEVATVLNKLFKLLKSKAFALTSKDPVSGISRVKIYSGSLGLSSSIKVTGGLAQKGLYFESQIQTPPSGSTPGSISWTVTVPQAGITRFKLTSATDVDMSLLRIGDYVLVTGTNFNSANRGSFSITNIDVRYVSGVLEQYFEIANSGFAQTPVTEVELTDVLFFRPTVKNIHADDHRLTLVAQTIDGIADVIIPATTQAVGRTIKSAAYGQLRESFGVSSFIRAASGLVTVTTTANHGLVAGQQVMVEETWGGTAGPTITVGNIASTSNPGTSNACLATIWSPIRKQDSISVIKHTLTLLNDGKILLVGGHQLNGSSEEVAQTDCGLFDITATATLATGVQYTYNWSAATDCNTARNRHTATLLDDGRVLVVGGYDGTTDTAMNDSELFTAGGSGSWAVGPTMGSSMRDHAAVKLANGTVSVLGGRQAEATNAQNSHYSFSPTTGLFTSPGAMPQARAEFPAILLDDGRVLAIGGRTDSSGNSTARCDTWDGSAWVRVGDMAYTRRLHSATKLSDGRVLVVGGNGRSLTQAGTANADLATAEVFDPGTNRWYNAGRMLKARKDHSAFLDGTVVVIAGGGQEKVEFFDTATWRWRLAPNHLPDASYTSSAVAKTPEGPWLMVGGDGADSLSYDAQLWIRASDTFSVGGLNGIFKLETGSSGTTLKYKTVGWESWTSNQNTELRVTPVAAIESDIPGPFIFDPEAGAAITGIATTTTQNLFTGQQYTTLNVTDASDFPDEEGYLAIGFGTATAVYPVRYLGRYSNTALILDYQHKMSATNLTGATVTYLKQKGTYVPDSPEEVGAFYITASPAGRVAAIEAMMKAMAAGLTLNLEVIYPGDRGLGGEGLPTTGQKISDKVVVWGGDDLDQEVADARGEE